MKTIAFLSTREKAAKTTLAVNLGVAWSQQGKKVVLSSIPCNPKIEEWLLAKESRASSSIEILGEESLIIHSFIGLDYIKLNYPLANLPKNQFPLLEKLAIQKYDYYILICNNSPLELQIAQQADLIVVNSDFSSAGETEEIIVLDRALQKISNKSSPVIDIIVPVKMDPKEWSNNSQRLFAVGEYLGYEKIANMIPVCERIHDLAKDNQTVWDLNQHNLKNAFRELLQLLS